MTGPPREVPPTTSPSPPASRLEVELRSQPDALARLADRGPTEVAALRSLTGDGVGGVVIVARGSSDNAARYAQYLVPARTGLPVTLATPSLATVYGHSPDMCGRLVVAVSQSGTSPDVVAVLADARAQGCPTVAVTNDPASALAAQADHVVALDVEERSVAATTTYTTSLLALALLGVALSDPAGDDAALADVGVVAGHVRAAITGTLGSGGLARVVDGLRTTTRAVAVGRGLNLSTAHEAALKVTELTGTLVAPFSPADLLHGPVAAVGPEVPALLIAPDEPASASVRDVADGLRGRGAPVTVFGPGGDLDLPAGTPGWLSPLVAVVPAQCLAWQLALARGVDVDAPGGLNQITTTR